MNSGRLRGSVVGGRQDKAVYIPDIYARTQNAWVDSFLQQNGYLGQTDLSILTTRLLFPPLSPKY